VTPDAAHSDDRQRVLDATDIADLVGEHVSLKRRGREFVGLCPFHDDSNPSMYIVPHKQIYHCFSCGAGGNALDFVINYHRMDFREALRLLADRAGVPLQPRKRDRPDPGGTGASESSRAELVEAARFAHAFFQATLRHPEHGATARDLIARRGFTEEMVEAFQIGAAPNRWDGLLLTASNKGVSNRALLDAGLLKPGREKPYDAFRNRLIFPILDQAGRPVGFGGRRLDDEEEPKYLNSPESALFDKSAALYGLHRAARAIQREGCAIVVEGYTDVIACHQRGVEHVVATLGTSLTQGHARALRRLCDTVVLLFDADDAGMRAADRAVEVFFAQPVDVRIAVLPEGKDPADLLEEPGGDARFLDAVARATDALEYRFQRLRERAAGAGLSARAALIEQDAARLKELGIESLAPVRRRLVVSQLASIAGVDEQSILDTLRSARSPRRAAPAETTPPDEDATAPPDAVDHVLACLLASPPLLAQLPDAARDLLRDAAYAADQRGRIAQALLDGDGAGTTSAIIGNLPDQASRRRAAHLVAVTKQAGDEDSELNQDFFQDCVTAALRQRRRRDADSAGGVDWDNVASNLEQLRTAHRDLRGDPAAWPRAAARPA